MTVDHKKRSSGHKKFACPRKSDRQSDTATTNLRSEAPTNSRSNSNDMGMLAQRLGSEGSWAETFVPSTPTGTIMTPTESSIAGDERAELLPSQDEQEAYHDDPPPSYTPSEPSSNPPQPQPNVGPSVLPPSDPEALPHVDFHCSRRSFRKSGCHNFMTFVPNRREHCRSRRRRCLKPIAWLATIAFLTLLMSGWQLASNYLFNNRSLPKPFVPTKNITQHETTGSIHGTFTLHDSIDLSTDSGSIAITIDARTGDKPAVIKLTTRTGSIHVSYISANLNGGKENQGIYEREFQTSITSDTGSVHVGSLLHGNGGSTYIQTVTGSIHAKIFTVGSGPDEKNSSLVTRLNTGSQHIDVQPLLKKGDQGSLKAVRAEHHALGAASVHAKYSSQWEGVVHGYVGGSGNVNIKGNSLEYQRNGSRDVYAWRGVTDPQEVTVELRSDASGSVHFQC